MKQNLLGCIEPIAKHIEALKLEHVGLVKTIPDFNFLFDKKMHVSDNVVYVYPSGSQTVSQRKTSNSRQRIAVGIAMAGKMNSPEVLSFYERVGETITELKTELINFVPENDKYGTRFYDPQFDTNDRHVYGDGFYFWVIRIMYDAYLSSK